MHRKRRSEHPIITLFISFRPIDTNSKLEKNIVSKEVCAWSGDVAKQLQGCFGCTDWDVFFHSSNNIDEVTVEVTDVITDYIKLCSESVVPKKTINMFLNNKPWVTPSLKKTLNEKQIAFCQK